MMKQEIFNRVKTMEMNEKDAFLERMITAIGDMEDYLLKGHSTASLGKDARNTAEELLKNFQEELRRRDEENLALSREIAELKNKVGEVTDLRETIADMEKQLEKMRHDHEQALKQRDEAKEESSRLQALWNKVTSR